MYLLIWRSSFRIKLLFKMKTLVLGLSLLVIAVQSNTTRDDIILFPLPMGSHVIQMERIGSALQARGYQIYTVMDNNSPKEIDMLRKAGFTVLQFQLSKETKNLRKQMFARLDRVALGEPVSVFEDMALFPYLIPGYCRDMLSDNQFMETVQRKSFKIALVDGFPMGPALMIPPYNLSIPTVLMGTIIQPVEIGVPSPPSFIVVQKLSFSQNMTFWQRLINTIISTLMQSSLSPMKQGRDLLQKYTDVDSWASLYSQIEFAIIPRDHHLFQTTPSMPHTLYLPGITYKPPSPLPQDLETFMTKHKSGTILVSFGSALDKLPHHTAEKFLLAFSKMKYLGVIRRFKTNTEKLNIPPNVKIVTWTPQNNILGHLKTALFITHCGSNGLHESVYHGVPMIGFPIFGDQEANAVMLEVHGLGIKMDINDFTVEELITNIESITTRGSKIQQNVNKQSAILKSYPLPAERAADAIEHVMKFGSDHLKGITMTMPAYKLYMVDIFAFIAGSLVFLLFIIITIMKKCYRKFSPAKKSKKE